MVLAVISWVAVLVGFVASWVAGRRRVGWLAGVAGCVLWGVYDVERGIWAGLLQAVVGAAISVGCGSL